MLPALTLRDLLQRSCCFFRVFISRGTWISFCVSRENWPWPQSAGIALDPGGSALSVTLSSSCLQTHSCIEQPGAGHRASQDKVGRQKQVHWGPLMGHDF